jgi:hypothetical protein
VAQPLVLNLQNHELNKPLFFISSLPQEFHCSNEKLTNTISNHEKLWGNEVLDGKIVREETCTGMNLAISRKRGKTGRPSPGINSQDGVVAPKVIGIFLTLSADCQIAFQNDVYVDDIDT